MNMETLSIETLKGFLSSQYKGWSSFVNNIIFPIFGEDNFESLSETELLENNPEEKPLAEATGICSIKQVGQIDIGVQPLQIFDVTVSDRVMMERNRVNIQRLIRKVMENYSSAFTMRTILVGIGASLFAIRKVVRRKSQTVNDTHSCWVLDNPVVRQQITLTNYMRTETHWICRKLRKRSLLRLLPMNSLANIKKNTISS